MFDGMQSGDQFHQFIASSRTSFPIPLSFPLNGSDPSVIHSFDPFTSHQLHLQLESSINNRVEQDYEEPASLISTKLVLERERSMPETTMTTDLGWSHNEVLALLRIRSNIENWFSDFTWEHVSRKLAELGFKRSADKCKEKFEEESRNFNSISYNKNYRIFSEHDDEFYPDDQDQEPHISAEKNQQNQEEEEDIGERNIVEGESERTVAASQENEEQVAMKPRENKKRKRREDKFEMFKGFCEAVVNKIMVHQEELHNKLLEDMLMRDEQKIAREDAWRNRHMEMIKKEIEIRAEEHATARERQATIIEFLKKFTSDSCEEDQEFVTKIQDLLKVNMTLPCTIHSYDQTTTTQEKVEAATSSSMDFIHQKPSSKPCSSSVLLQNPNPAKPNENNQLELTPSSRKRNFKNLHCESGDSGNRWARDEVLALINLRCKLNNNDEIKDGEKGPLWERISQGMLELGYGRNAKRCKEKWENINKYFRKTKDSSKKRSLDSRTCPYFQQLSGLYSQGKLVVPNNEPENQ
ncbi:trihelix transcription factor GTL2 [Olea europaea subsp. europaea]|uniref:Trihelix transcription factor GTL2 n=1 Tax=Olea europaea subsp. europaea TaxID=158383 RepID=A0A8S0S0N2_OLEEU|nr:trihelix transcription factor GTL2 [Olea europaea subsp. europaea]